MFEGLKGHYAVWLFDAAKKKKKNKWTKTSQAGKLKDCSRFAQHWNEENEDTVAVAWPSWKEFDPDDFTNAAPANRGGRY